MRGKYSPTVLAAYAANQEWWANYSSGNRSNVFESFDPEGYDSYGYDANSTDRAGNREHVYYGNDADPDSGDDYNLAFERAADAWTFDGVKPVRR